MDDLSPPAEKICAHVFVSGQVQGVGYRYSTFQQAKQQGVSGWVRNLPNGQVEAIFEGSATAVEATIRWCHQGPPAAAVTKVAVEYEDPQGRRSFEIKRR